MGYGLKIVNPSGELVISSDGLGLSCIHKATWVSTTQPTGVATNTAPGRVSGFSTYTSNASGQIICAIDIVEGKHTSILEITGSSGAWTIKAYCGDTPDSNGFEVQYAVDVWVYATPTAAATFGLALYKSNGVLAYDLSQLNPLFPRAYIYHAKGSLTGITIPSLTRPVAMGSPAGDRVFTTTLGFNLHSDTTKREVFSRSGTTLVISEVTTQRYEYPGPDASGSDREDGSDTSTFIIEGALLP